LYYDIRAEQLARGYIFIDNEITSELAGKVLQQMMYLEHEGIQMSIMLNTSGGSVSAGLMIYDAIRGFGSCVRTICTGTAASMGAVLLSAAPKGQRFIFPHGRVLIHEPLIRDGLAGAATTIQKTAESIIETKHMMDKILSEHSGKPMEDIALATSFDNLMTAREAVEFGLVDRVIGYDEIRKILM